MKRSQQVYERLVQAFPHEFKLAHGDDMLETGGAAMAHSAKRRGCWPIPPCEYLTKMRCDLQQAMSALIKSPGFALVDIPSMELATNVYSSN
jgi:hypothetical protein